MGSSLEDGLNTLGQVLDDEGRKADLVVVGAGALLLLGELVRSTADLDAVARMNNGVLEAAQPFPRELVLAIRKVGAALDLPYIPRNEKDWLNPGPSFLLNLGLPDGFASRLTTRAYG